MKTEIEKLKENCFSSIEEVNSFPFFDYDEYLYMKDEGRIPYEELLLNLFHDCQSVEEDLQELHGLL